MMNLFPILEERRVFVSQIFIHEPLEQFPCSSVTSHEPFMNVFKKMSWANGSRTVHEPGSSRHTNGALSHRVSSNDAPHPDDAVKNAVRKKILHYRQVYVDKTDPIIFSPCPLA